MGVPFICEYLVSMAEFVSAIIALVGVGVKVGGILDVIL